MNRFPFVQKKIPIIYISQSLVNCAILDCHLFLVGTSWTIGAVNFPQPPPGKDNQTASQALMLSTHRRLHVPTWAAPRSFCSHSLLNHHYSLMYLIHPFYQVGIRCDLWGHGPASYPTMYVTQPLVSCSHRLEP